MPPLHLALLRVRPLTGRTARTVPLRMMLTLAVAAAGLTAVQAAPASAVPARATLTAEARAVGLEPGNATMGWRHAALQPAGGARSALTTNATSRAYQPSGVLGIDVSSYQGTVNWSGYAARGRAFAYVKATEGTSYRNPYFASQYGGAASAGLLRGAYHFASPRSSSGRTQAAYFVRHGGGWTLDGRTLPGVLDVEYNPYGATCYGLSDAAMVSWINSFVVEYKRLTSRDAVIYTTTDWWRQCTNNTTRFSYTNPLWLARYGTSIGTLPGSWGWATFWQYSNNPIDQNKFSSRYDRLVVLARDSS